MPSLSRSHLRSRRRQCPGAYDQNRDLNYVDAAVLVTNPVFIGFFERPCLEPPPYVLDSITTFEFLVGFKVAAHVSVTCGVRVCLLVAVRHLVLLVPMDTDRRTLRQCIMAILHV